MGKYRLVFKRSVSKDFRSIPESDVVRILQRLEGLQDDPRPSGSEKLTGQQRYRLRQGVYRIIYQIADEELIVTVVKIGHRRHIYRRY